MTTTQIQLRDYQLECLEAIKTAARRGVKRQLVALPTGTGKTVIFSQLPRMIKGGRKMLVVAHRTELLDQAAEKIPWANPGLAVEIEQADRHISPNAQCIVASVQTLSVSPKRIENLELEKIALIVVDEAHHIIASSYLGLLNKLGLAPDITDKGETGTRRPGASRRALFANFKPASTAPSLIGFTATPHRTDTVGLEAVLDEIAYSKTIEEMMRAGWLCKIIGKRISTNTDISGVHTSHGDYQEGELANSVNTKERNLLAVRSYQGLGTGRQALVFCVDVAHTQDMCQAFQDAGISAGYVVGSTPKDERAKTIQDHKSGNIAVMVGCGVFTEGYDDPSINCIIMARPTKSSLVYTQCLGRGTRIAPFKLDLLVIDLVDVGATGVQSVNTLFGLPVKLNTDDGVLATQDAFKEEADQLSLASFAEAVTMEDVRRMARDFDPLQQAMMPEHIRHSMAWVRTSYGYALSVANGHLGIVENLLGQCSLRIRSRSAEGKNGPLGWYNDVQNAINAAEKYARDTMGGYAVLLDKDAKWRTSSEKATPAQIKWLTRKKIAFPEGITKGQAAMLLSRAFSGGEK